MDVIDQFVADALISKQMAFDIEHDPNVGMRDPDFHIHGCGFYNGKTAIYVKSAAAARRITDVIFPNPEIECITYNGKYDIQGTVIDGWALDYPENFVDVMMAVNLLEDNRKPNEIGLKTVVRDVFGHKMTDFETAIKFGLDSPEFTKYGTEDVIWTYRLWGVTKEQLEAQNLLRYFQKVPAYKVFADMERAGIKWDLDQARNLLRGYVRIRDELEAEVFKEIGPLNLNSGDQVATRLFDELEYPTTGLKRTAKGRISTDAATMDLLASRFPICKKISLYKTAAKLISTYVAPLTEKAMDSPDQRIHPTFWLVSSTGRTRASDPNLQNQPSFLDPIFEGYSIKKAFVPRPGYKFIVADLSQIELRLVAHYSKDPMYLDAYRNWECTACGSRGSATIIMHKCPKCGCAENEAILKNTTAVGFWHGLDLHSMTADSISALHGNRQWGKVANFALIYMATARRMNQEYPELSVVQWDKIIDEYFNVYSGVRQWHQKVEMVLQTLGVYKDIFGRQRRIPRDLIQHSYKHCLNQLVNFGPQSSACGMMQRSMTNMRDYFRQEGMWMKTVFPVNMVHDEIILEVAEEDVQYAVPQVVHWMEHSTQIEVPCRTSVAVVDNWADGK